MAPPGVQHGADSHEPQPYAEPSGHDPEAGGAA